jgi:hypothetical protein
MGATCSTQRTWNSCMNDLDSPAVLSWKVALSEMYGSEIGVGRQRNLCYRRICFDKCWLKNWEGCYRQRSCIIYGTITVSLKAELGSPLRKRKTRESVIGVATTLRVWTIRGSNPQVGQQIFLLSTTSRQALGPSQPLIQLVRGSYSGSKATGAWIWSLFQFDALVKNEETMYLYLPTCLCGANRDISVLLRTRFKNRSQARTHAISTVH